MSPDSPLQSGVQALSVPPSLALLASRPPGQVLGNSAETAQDSAALMPPLPLAGRGAQALSAADVTSGC